MSDTNNAAAVVVGVDDSEVAHAALDFAAREAGHRGAQLVVATAVRPDADTRGGEQAWDAVAKRSARVIASAYPSLDCQVVVRPARAATLLIELSAEADLLVVGTHRAGRLRGFVLGSVSQQVAARAACPVVTLSGPPEHDQAPIVLGASPSPGGLAAARFAFRQAMLWQRPVRAVRSTIVEDWALSTPGNAFILDGELLRAAAQASLDPVLRIAAEEYPDVTVTGEIRDESPFAVLPTLCGEASLMVIGSRRGRSSPLPHLGPVASWLLHQATCPLAVVGFDAGDSSPEPD